MHNSRIPKLLSALAAPLLGLGSVLLPVWILEKKILDAPLFPLIRTGVDAISTLSLLLLFGSGILLGLLGRANPVLSGLLTMALFPFFALAEVFADPTSHNLWPIEFLLYGLISLVAVLGACIGRFLQQRIKGT